MDREPDNNESELVGRRRKANVRLALLLALVAVVIYFGFILSHV